MGIELETITPGDGMSLLISLHFTVLYNFKLM